MFLQYNDLNQGPTNWLGVAQLYAGARDGNDEVVGQLLGQLNIIEDIYSDEGYTPFLVAVKNNHTAVVELFLNRARADPNAKIKRSGSRPSALGLAARYGYEPITQLLLGQQNLDLGHIMSFRAKGYVRGNAQSVARHFGHEAVAAMIRKAMIQQPMIQQPIIKEEIIRDLPEYISLEEWEQIAASSGWNFDDPVMGEKSLYSDFSSD